MKENNKMLTDKLLKLAEFDFSKYDEAFLQNSIEKRMVETQCNSQKTYFSLLDEKTSENQHFIDSLQVGYTEFFRNQLTFSILEKVILPSLVSKLVYPKKKEIRIWSAACASGQEIYSLSMLLNEYSTGEKINFRIFATDQSEFEIEEAKKGQYSLLALSSLSLNRLNRWFTKHGDIYTIKEALKEKIEFSTYNLFDKEHCCPPSSIFGDFDLIFCANILFYYKPEFRKKIVEKISNCLSTNGYLITGETEREILMQYHFQEVIPQSAIFRK